MTNLPTTPAEARAEQKRVLELLQPYREAEARFEASGGEDMAASIDAYQALEAMQAQAPTLATDLANAYGLIATLLDAQAERERVIEQVQKLIRAARNDLDILSGSVTLDGETTCDDLGENLDAALRTLATAPAGGES